MSERKDRLIQARVPEKLESTLKEEARKRRTTVSQMIRHVLEDTFELVDGVVANVDQIVSDSVELAQQVGRGARRLSESARSSRADCRDPLPNAENELEAVQAWNEVVLNRAVPCTKCGAVLERGSTAYMGVGDGPGPSAWVCALAVDSLSDEESLDEDDDPERIVT